MPGTDVDSSSLYSVAADLMTAGEYHVVGCESKTSLSALTAFLRRRGLASPGAGSQPRELSWLLNVAEVCNERAMRPHLGERDARVLTRKRLSPDSTVLGGGRNGDFTHTNEGM